MNNFDINEIVRIETMPKVFSQLEMIGSYIDEQIKDIDKLECNEENKIEVKKRRTEINNTLKLLDDKRKEIKNTLLEPYEIFNEKYEQECKDKLLNASEILKSKIDNIEEQQKLEKENELKDFFKQHCEANNIEFLKFDDIGLNITLSSSIKSLKEQILSIIEKVKENLKLIELEEYKDEIYLEYQQNLDFTKSKLDVIQRHKLLEEIQKNKEQQEEINKQEEKVIEKVEEVITPPKEIINDEDVIKVTFTIETTKSNIIELKNWLNERNIKYE